MTLSVHAVDGGTRRAGPRYDDKAGSVKGKSEHVYDAWRRHGSPSVETRTFRGKQMIDAWNQIGLDYSVLGNHEFDIKTEEILERIKESKFTWLGSNVFDTKTRKLFADLPTFVIARLTVSRSGSSASCCPKQKRPPQWKII